MSDITLILIGAGIGMVSTLLGVLLTTWLNHRFRVKENDLTRQVEIKTKALNDLAKGTEDPEIIHKLLKSQYRIYHHVLRKAVFSRLEKNDKLLLEVGESIRLIQPGKEEKGDQTHTFHKKHSRQSQRFRQTKRIKPNKGRKK